MEMTMVTQSPTPSPPPTVGELLHDIERDIRTIAVDELELSRRKLGDFVESLVVKASIALLGATVALIGLGMLCMVAVIAFEPVIHPAWLRLMIMAVVYIVLGGSAVALYGKRMVSRGPDLDKQIEEVRETVDAVGRGLEH
jgi:hypothetical protein